MTKRIAALAAVFGVAALLVGCSAPAAAPVTAPAPSAEADAAAEPSPRDAAIPDESTCALLAGVDIAALLAQAPGEQSDSGGICKIVPADGDSAASVLVQVVGPPNGAAYFERDRDLLGSSGAIAGLGDDAYYAGPYRVNVLAGDNYLIVQVLRELFDGTARLTDAELMAAVHTVYANTGW